MHGRMHGRNLKTFRALALLALAAVTPPLCAQTSEGNADKDGTVVPRFEVPGGSISIRNGGEASVTVALPVPPGVHGMAPSVTLSYTSGAKEQGLGVGWSLDLGQPDAIRRSSLTRGVPRYDASDLFTWGGQDLVPIGNGEYRTRIDSFRRIVRSGESWTIQDKGGMSLEYGTTPAERSVIPEKPAAYEYHLSRILDSFGNAIEFSYDGPQNARRLTAIRYTLNGGSLVGQEQRVELVWQARDDVRTSYRYGGEVVLDQRLDKLRTWSQGRLVRSFELCYAEEACGDGAPTRRGHARLAALLESAADGTALPSRRFHYQERELGWQANSSDQAFEPPLYLTYHYQANLADWLHPWDTGVRPVDLDGDGLLDFVQGQESKGQLIRSAWLNDGKTGWHQVTDGRFELPQPFVVQDLLLNTIDWGQRLEDVNGDGLPDLIHSCGTGGPGTFREVWLNDGRGWPQSGGYQLPAPEGDENAFLFVDCNTFAHTSQDRGVRMADLNGDGLVDLVKARQGERRHVYLNDGKSGWTEAPDWVFPEPELYFLDRHGSDPPSYEDTALRLVDINADGLADLVQAQIYTTFRGESIDTRRVWLNTGSGWAPSTWSFPAYFRHKKLLSTFERTDADLNLQVLDVDGDGYPDVVGRIPVVSGDEDDSRSYVLLNDQAGGFVAIDEWIVPKPLTWRVTNLSHLLDKSELVDAGIRFMDVDGDGLADMLQSLYVDTALAKGEVTPVYLAKPAIADLLVEYTNALGGLSRLGYSRVSGLGLPAGQMPFTKTVATSLTQDAALGDPLSRVDYAYEGGLFDPVRHEFRGFARVVETRADVTRCEKSFYQDEGRAAFQKSEVLRDSDGKVYASHFWDFSSTQAMTTSRRLKLGAGAFAGLGMGPIRLVPAPSGVFRTLLDAERVYSLNQDDEQRYVLKRTEYLDYDGYGNPREVRELGFDGAVARRSRTAYVVEPQRYLVLPWRTERFEGTAADPIVTEESCYGECGTPPASTAVTRRAVTDHRLADKILASGGATTATRYAHDAYGNVTEEHPGRGEPTYRSFEGNGFLFPYETRRGQLRTITLHDRAHGGLLEYRDPNDQLTAHAYDGLGRLRSTSYPDFPTDPALSVSYELGTLPAYVEVRQKLDDRRTRTTREYRDGLGRAKGSVSGAGSDWTVSGLVAYDARGRVRTAYEPFFQPSAALPASGPAGLTTVYDYEDDKLSLTTLPGGDHTTNAYDADAVISTDENGVSTYRRHDAFGQLVEVRGDEGGTTSPQPVSRFGYDGLGRPAWSEDPRGLRTLSLHDANGRLRGLSAPDGAEALRNGYRVWNDYDENGNQTHHWAGSDVTLTEYDDYDRPTNLYTSRDGLVSRYGESTRSYDVGQYGMGHLTGVVGYGPPLTVSTLQYDARGRVLEERLSLRELDASLPARLAVNYAYDRDGALSGIRDPRGNWIQYSRNVRGQLDGESGPAVSLYAGQPEAVRIKDIDYDAAGRVTAVHYAHGAVDVFDHDARGRVLSIGGSGPLQIGYGYDPAGNLLSERQGGLISLTHTYDRLNRLETSVGTTTRGAVSLTYDYDLSGNQLSVTGQGAPNLLSTIQPGTNRLATVLLASDPELEALHDAHGNLTDLVDTMAARYLRRFSYDALGRLRSYQVSASPHYRTGSASGSLVYDGYGRKVRRSFPGGGSEVYVHTTSGQVLASYKKGSWTTYLLADGRRLGWADAQGYGSYIHSDRLGSARAISVPDYDQDCGDKSLKAAKQVPDPCPTSYRVTWRGEYLPFGYEVERRAGADDFRFTGQEMDEGMGVYDYGARYYDPLLGRFLQVDPYLGDPGDPPTLNRYSYALNNPLANVDPSGNQACDPAKDACPEEAPTQTIVLDEIVVEANDDDVTPEQRAQAIQDIRQDQLIKGAFGDDTRVRLDYMTGNWEFRSWFDGFATEYKTNSNLPITLMLTEGQIARNLAYAFDPIGTIRDARLEAQLEAASMGLALPPLVHGRGEKLTTEQHVAGLIFFGFWFNANFGRAAGMSPYPAGLKVPTLFTPPKKLEATSVAPRPYGPRR